MFIQGQGPALKVPYLVHAIHHEIVQAVPRINSKGCLYGSVYRVASERNINNVEAN